MHTDPMYLLPLILICQNVFGYNPNINYLLNIIWLNRIFNYLVATLLIKKIFPKNITEIPGLANISEFSKRELHILLNLSFHV